MLISKDYIKITFTVESRFGLRFEETALIC
jgi:hypothetical protein